MRVLVITEELHATQSRATTPPFTLPGGLCAGRRPFSCPRGRGGTFSRCNKQQREQQRWRVAAAQLRHSNHEPPLWDTAEGGGCGFSEGCGVAGAGGWGHGVFAAQNLDASAPAEGGHKVGVGGCPWLIGMFGLRMFASTCMAVLPLPVHVPRHACAGTCPACARGLAFSNAVVGCLLLAAPCSCR